MEHQLLQLAGVAVVGLPGFQFVVVAQNQLGQVLSVFAVVLGAAGNEGLAEFLEADRVDGIEGDPGVGFQEDDEIAAGCSRQMATRAWGWSRRSWTSQS